MIVKKLSDKKIQIIDKVPIICWIKEEDYKYWNGFFLNFHIKLIIQNILGLKLMKLKSN